jgi:hypothetical protein
VKKRLNSDTLNKKFDDKLINMGLSDFERISNYVSSETKIDIYHKKCKQTFSVAPSNFLRRKYKCPYCDKIIPANKCLKPRNEEFQIKLDKATNGEFILLSDYYACGNYIKLKHNVCNHIFESRDDNFFNRYHKCPNCSKRPMHNNSTFKQRIKRMEKLLGNEYEILTKTFKDKDYLKIRHKKCDTAFELNTQTILYSGHKKIKCPECEFEERREAFLDKLSSKHKGEFTLRGKYINMNTPTVFRHKKCKNTFNTTPSNILKYNSTSCPHCKNDNKQNRFKEKLSRYKNGEYELIGEYIDGNSKIKLLHKTCNKIFDVYPCNIFRSKCICPNCKKNTLGKRDI